MATSHAEASFPPPLQLQFWMTSLTRVSSLYERFLWYQPSRHPGRLPILFRSDIRLQNWQARELKLGSNLLLSWRPHPRPVRRRIQGVALHWPRHQQQHLRRCWVHHVAYRRMLKLAWALVWESVLYC